MFWLFCAVAWLLALTATEAFAQSVTNNGPRTTIVASSVPKAVIINSETGTISTSSDGSVGIFSSGDDARITNSGSISTSGNGSSGIYSAGDDAMITSSGSISTSGALADGIFLTGDGGTITISGSMSVTGAGSYAVRGFDAGDQTLTLLPGAHISGRINLGEVVSDNDIVNIVTNAAAPLRTYTFEGADTFNLGELAVRSNATVVVIDPTGSSAERMALGSAAGQIRQSVFQRLADTWARGMGGDAGGTTRGSWGTFFGGGHERDDDGLAQAWSSNRFGAVAGYDIRLDSSYRVGLFAGGSRGHIETDVRSIKTDTNSGFIGAYGQRILGGGIIP